MIDVFRATSAIITALQNGVKEIIPVKDIEDALEYKHKGYITAAERKGEIVEGFDFGNSPFAFMDPALVGKTVVLTTSNCTMAMLQVKHAKKAFAGAFTNISAIAERLYQENEDVLLLCAGWKNKFSIEDSLFAGALADRLIKDYDFDSECDSALSSITLYHSVKDNIPEFLKKSSHRRRLGHLNLAKDIEYCLKHDQASVVPQFDGHRIRIAKVAVLNEE